jgi:hypothetical protein
MLMVKVGQIVQSLFPSGLALAFGTKFPFLTLFILLGLFQVGRTNILPVSERLALGARLFRAILRSRSLFFLALRTLVGPVIRVTTDVALAAIGRRLLGRNKRGLIGFR